MQHSKRCFTSYIHPATPGCIAVSPHLPARKASYSLLLTKREEATLTRLFQQNIQKLLGSTIMTRRVIENAMQLSTSTGVSHHYSVLRRTDVSIFQVSGSFALASFFEREIPASWSSSREKSTTFQQPYQTESTRRQ